MDKKELCKRVWHAIDHVGYDVRQTWNYCAVQQVSGDKQNYSVEQWLNKAADCVRFLKEHYPVKYVRSQYGKILFYFDDTKIKEDITREEEEAEARRIAKINAVDLTPYKPTKKILDKLTGYFNKGSKVNCGAIKDITKILTYYYAAQLLNWDDLWYGLNETSLYTWDWKDKDGVDFRTVREAIELRVNPDPMVTLVRGRADDRLLNFSKTIWKAVKASGLDFDFQMVKPTVDECWKDALNGCACTIAYDLTVGDKKVHFSEVTNEGVDSPSFGFQFQPSYRHLMNKGEFERSVLSELGLA